MADFTLLHMSLGSSLERWHQVGFAGRELSYLDALQRHVGAIRLATFGQEGTERELLRAYDSSVELGWTLPEGYRRLPYGALLSSLRRPKIRGNGSQCKLVRSFQFPGSWMGLRIARDLRIPFVLRCGYVFSIHYARRRAQAATRARIVRRLEGVIARAADAVIVSYDGARQFFIATHNVKPAKVHVIGNAVNISRFRPGSAAFGMRDVLSVARLVPQKNLEALVAACGIAKANLTLIGTGELADDLRRLADVKCVDLRIISRVDSRELAAHIRGHRVFALPSHYEGNPKSLLEAMACGVPCVASNIPEHRSLIAHEHTGLLCDTDAHSIAASVSLLLAEEPFRTRLGGQAIKFIRMNYSEEALAAKEASIHAGVLEGTGDRAAA